MKRKKLDILRQMKIDILKWIFLCQIMTFFKEILTCSESDMTIDISKWIFLRQIAKKNETKNVLKVIWKYVSNFDICSKIFFKTHSESHMKIDV